MHRIRPQGHRLSLACIQFRLSVVYQTAGHHTNDALQYGELHVLGSGWVNGDAGAHGAGEGNRANERSLDRSWLD